jgi:hypothetical protein
MTPRRIAVAILFLAGAALIALGVRNQLRQREAVDVVNAFLTAIQKGDRDAALACLQTGPGGGSTLASSDFPLWTPAPDVSCRVTELEIDGDTARAKVRIERDGFVLEPTLHLVHDSSWKIARIDDLKIDPRWLEMQREAARLQGERHAGELQRALKGREGVTVRRAPLPGREPR